MFPMVACCYISFLFWGSEKIVYIHIFKVFHDRSIFTMNFDEYSDLVWFFSHGLLSMLFISTVIGELSCMPLSQTHVGATVILVILRKLRNIGLSKRRRLDLPKLFKFMGLNCHPWECDGVYIYIVFSWYIPYWCMVIVLLEKLMQ